MGDSIHNRGDCEHDGHAHTHSTGEARLRADVAEDEQLDCSAVLADVWLYLDNECDPQARARVRQHLEHCQSCLRSFGIENQLKDLINRKCGGDSAPQLLKERLIQQFSARGGPTTS